MSSAFLFLCLFAFNTNANTATNNNFNIEISDLSLEALLNLDISTASKRSEKIHEAPGILTTITAQEFQRFGASNLYEVLEKVTAFYPTGSNFFPKNVMAVRGDLLGHYDNHILLLINGRPIRESYSGGVNFSIYNAFPIEMVERLEIIRGPGSVLYGTNAYSGVINIITVTPEESGGSVNLGSGSFGTTQAGFSGSIQKEKFQLNAGLKVFKEDGWELSATDNNGNFGSQDMSEDNLGAFLNIKMGKFTINSLHTHSDQGFIGASVAFTGNPPLDERHMESTRSFIDLGHEFDMGSRGVMKSNISYATMNFDHYNYKATAKDLFLEVTHLWDLHEKVNLLYGVTWWDQNVGSKEGLRPAPVPDFGSQWVNAYAEISYKPTEKVKFTAGGQYNKPEGVDSDFVPRLGAIFHFNDSFGAKLLYSEAFRSAFGVETGFLLILRNPDGSIRGGLRGNPSLGPEKIASREAEIYYHAENFQVSVAMFHSEHENLVTRERAADGVLDFINKGELSVDGFEVESKWLPNGSFYMSASYAYQSNENDEDIEDFTFVPNQMFKIGMAYNRPGFSIGVFDTWFGDAADVVNRSPNRADVNPAADAHHLVSLKLSTNLSHLFRQEQQRWSLSLRATNLLDEEAHHPEFIGRRVNTLPGNAGRSIYAQLGFKF